jgi:CHAT domain-containing protein
MADIYSMRLSADLVVLSACEIALGRQIRGEGLMGLTHGFRAAGARRVMASLWRVPDAATRELMAAFYEPLLRRNETPSAALRAAQLKLLSTESRRHPYYWAAFAVYGN